MRNCQICGARALGVYEEELGHLCDSCMEEFLERTEFYCVDVFAEHDPDE